ncbi:MAG: 4Fe-4S binding protein [Blautia sp.]|nr:4Fe-4S binding protein [Blautia sp.]
MKKLKVKRGIECMNCLACVLECSDTYFKSMDPAKAALYIAAKKNDPNDTRPTVCVQCGKCAEACPNNAIIQNKLGVYTVNKKLCTGCGECVEACPFKVMRKPEDSPVAFKCIACGKCAKACPQELLEVVTG